MPTRPRQGFLQDAAALLDAGTPWAGLGGDSLAFVLSTVAREGRWLLVVDDADRAARLVQGLRFFHHDPKRVEPLPADDHRPYDGFSASATVVAARLRTLERVARQGDLIVVAEARALRQRIPDRATRRKGTRQIAVGDTLERDELVHWLSDAGYLAGGLADGPGRYAVRGDVVDVWSTAATGASRVEFFDDEVESLRRLTDDLRPGRKRKRMSILPAREERIDAEARERLADRLHSLSRGGADAARRRRLVEALEAGVRPSALEDLLPALVPTEAPLEALADLRAVVVQPLDVAAVLRDHEDQARRRYELLGEEERPLVTPDMRYVPAAEVQAALAGAHHVHEGAAAAGAVDLGARLPESFAVRGAELAPVVERLVELAGQDVRVGLVAESEERADRVAQMLQPHGLRPRRGAPEDLERGKVSLVVGDLARGFVARQSGWCFVPLSALFGVRARADRDRAHTMFEASVQDTGQLKDGDLVVHRMHGVGRYLGLQRLPIGEHHQDFARLEYKGGDLLFLPVTKLAELSRFNPANSEATVTLDRLGGQSWTRRKGKVRDNLLKMADELMQLHAKRELAVRPALDAPGARYQTFEARFPHVETPDQAEAILAVQDDLSKPYPMDRLICGDVGFGKTEVAMRAAMRMVENGRQVAVLCPTTVLAYQHHRSFVERFGHERNVKVGMLSRFADRQMEQEVLEGLADGSCDIVIATTALLGRRVRVRDLGLLVIDEEHRFGVKQKERLKKLRTEVDVLSMSATPIPRTLQMALGGLRELSLITTPPTDRLSVRTSTALLSETRVRDAIHSELEREGQAYVIHNRVETIERFADKLRGWMPEVGFAVAHGQMGAEALEHILVDFIERRIDVLVCTTIFESGIDLPNVNTMLIDRADRFGLAQLYQLRGRVGRSDRRATCLLLTPEDVSLEARKRLAVLVENSRLGSGFHIAAADLELRGGGNLMGSAQSGNIDQVGWDTWVELLESAVRQARGRGEKDEMEPEIHVPVDAFLPDALVTDPQERLAWYQRIGNARTPEAVERVVDELEGWVGSLPPETHHLAGQRVIFLECRELGVERLSWMRVRAVLDLHPHGDATKGVARVVRAHPKRFSSTARADGGVELAVRFTPREAERPFRFLRWVMAQLRRAT